MADRETFSATVINKVMCKGEAQKLRRIVLGNAKTIKEGTINEVGHLSEPVAVADGTSFTSL